MAVSVEKIEKACVDAKDKLTQLNIEEQLVGELEWCLGSYAHEGNPSGSVLKGKEALTALETLMGKIYSPSNLSLSTFRKIQA